MKKLISILLLLSFFLEVSHTQTEVEILDYKLNAFNQIEVEVESTEDVYFILFSRHTPTDPNEFPVSITMGEDGKTVLTEQLEAHPIEHYTVRRYSRNNPGDIDRDGKDDIAEFLDPITMAPLNPAPPIAFINGTNFVKDKTVFDNLSYQGTDVLIDTHLSQLQFVKFYIIKANTNAPEIYFMNTKTHRAHFRFANAVGIPSGFGGGGGGSDNNLNVMRGEIVYHPFVDDPTGRPGVYRFEFEPNDSYRFTDVQKAYELLSRNMPFLKNNWTYFPMPNAALPRYIVEKSLFDNSRVQILLAEDLFFDISYIPFNITEGYGFLRVMELNERPNQRDVVLYESLPNEMPRVGGIITSVPQTPLSHVNLRAIQDKVPNAYIRGASDVDQIKSLIGKWVYFNVAEENYEIKEASIADVNRHYDALRPIESQIPIRDLSQTSIKDLDDISFTESSAFGVKTANLATMRTFGFPENTIPDGFGIPFYYYDEFMKHNDFYTAAQQMIDDPDFTSDSDKREDLLKEFRSTIKDADLPQWMYNDLDSMQKSFEDGISIRCRSSTNNEDLPGFSGAGLYDSKTQKPDEGHIEKSIKQVYASMWNFRAFDEREFYRINHFEAAMGVLVHPNFVDEKANGVGVSIDPINNLTNAFYLNTQVGEDLVTNPEALSIPEEMLLDATSNTGAFFKLIRRSNQIEDSRLIIKEGDLSNLQQYLRKIHDEFKILYEAEDSEDFAMEIEYKITKDDYLSIKQARPWAAFWTNQITSTRDIELIEADDISLNISPNPFHDETNFSFTLNENAEITIDIYSLDGTRISQIVQDRFPQGNHQVIWQAQAQNGTDIGSGLYLYRIQKLSRNKIEQLSGTIIKQ